jgi:Flp pilus assembly protein protease CpaA
LEIVSAFLTLIILASFYAAFVGTVNMIYALHENEMVEELRLSSLKNPEASFPYIFGIGDIIHLRLEA